MDSKKDDLTLGLKNLVYDVWNWKETWVYVYLF